MYLSIACPTIPLCAKPRSFYRRSWTWGEVFDSNPGAIENIIVKSSVPLLGVGGGYWGIPFDKCIIIIILR